MEQWVCYWFPLIIIQDQGIVFLFYDVIGLKHNFAAVARAVYDVTGDGIARDIAPHCSDYA